MPGQFTESKHPRLHGKFAKKLSELGGGQSAHLPGGTKVVKSSGRAQVFNVRGLDGVTVSTHDTPHRAASAAIEHDRAHGRSPAQAAAHNAKSTQPTDSGATPPALAKMTPVARARHARNMERSAKTQQEKLKWHREALRWEAQISRGKK